MAQNQLTVAKQQSNFLFDLYYVFVLAVVTGVIATFGVMASFALSAAPVYFPIFLILLGVALWTFGGAYVSIPMTIYLNKKYRDKRYSELDIAHARALKLLSKLPCRKTLDVPIMMSNLGLMRLCQGHYENAEDLFRQAYSYIKKDRYLRDSFAAAILLNNLACACLRRGNLVEAELHANEALEILSKPKSKQYKIMTALPHAVIGNVHARLSEYDTSVEHLTEAIEIYQNYKAPAGTIGASLLQGKTHTSFWLAYDFAKMGKWPESEKHLQSALTLIDEDSSAINALTIEIMYMLANEYMNVQKFDRAERLLDLAYGLCVETPFHPDAKNVLNYYEKLLLITDRQAEVADLRAWLRPHGPALIGASPFSP